MRITVSIVRGDIFSLHSDVWFIVNANFLSVPFRMPFQCIADWALPIRRDK